MWTLGQGQRAGHAGLVREVGAEHFDKVDVYEHLAAEHLVTACEHLLDGGQGGREPLLVAVCVERLRALHRLTANG